MFSLPLYDVCNGIDIPPDVNEYCHMSNYVIFSV